MTLNVSPPALSVPRAYFMLARPAVCVTLKLRGVKLSKKVLTICRAWARLASLSLARTAISRLSANQAERASALPAAIYLLMGTNTSSPPSAAGAGAGCDVFCNIKFCARATGPASARVRSTIAKRFIPPFFFANIKPVCYFCT